MFHKLAAFLKVRQIVTKSNKFPRDSVQHEGVGRNFMDGFVQH